MNGRLLEDMHKQRTEEMNQYWKTYWKDKYKNKTVKRSLKSMARMEKYKYMAYPNYPMIPQSHMMPQMSYPQV